MTNDPPRMSFALDEELKEYLDSLDNASERLRELVREDMARSGDKRTRLEDQLEEVEEEIAEKEAELEELRSKRDRLIEQLEELDEEREEHIEQICEGLTLIKGSRPDRRDIDSGVAQKAANIAHLSARQIIELADDIDVGHYKEQGSPDSLSDDERERVEEWAEFNL